MSGSRSLCCSCGPCKPKWMRMVDNIYSNPQDSSNHSKLVFFCVRKPDKLDRIGSYLHRRLSGDLTRRKYAQLSLTMEAINSILNACHSQRLNMFVVSFLKMVQLLLETNQPDLQIMGTKSFVQFSQIEEDTPNYHREYDQLISHFARMCQCTHPDHSVRSSVRVSGINGIQGIIQKSTTDLLQVNVLHSACMNQILPALLFNIREGMTLETCREDDTSGREAQFVFKDIVSRSSVGNIKPVLSSLLTYLDENQLWTPNEFPLFIFALLLDSIKNSQSAHTIVKQLVEHLSRHQDNLSSKDRTGIVQVIGRAVIILAKEAIGPDVFHNFKSLLQMLRLSISKTSRSRPQSPSDVTSGSPVLASPTHRPSFQAMQSSLSSPCLIAVNKAVPISDSNDSALQDSNEQAFQEAISSTIAEFAKNLPDTHKIEIMKFILNFEPMINERHEGGRCRPLIKVLLRTMLTVATQYKTISISSAINTDFLNLLLNGAAVDSDPGVRLIVQKILHTLIDRHGNTEELLSVKVYKPNCLNDRCVWEKPSRQDVMFMKRSGSLLLENLHRQLLNSNNRVDNLEHVFCTLGLVALEINEETILCFLLRLALSAQRSIEPLPLTHKCAVHALIAALLSLICQMLPVEGLENHVHEVIDAREKTAPYLLPRIAFNRGNTAGNYPTNLELNESILFSQELIKDLLKNAGCDVTTFLIPYDRPSLTSVTTKPFSHRKASTFAYMNDVACSELRHSLSTFSVSASDASSQFGDIPEDVDENNDYSFEAFRKILNEPMDSVKKKRNEEEQKIMHYFKTTDFDEICRHQKEKMNSGRDQIWHVLDGISCDIERGKLLENHYIQKAPTVWDIEYPALFLT